MCFLEEEAYLLTKSGTQALGAEMGLYQIPPTFFRTPAPAMAPQLEWLYSIHKTGS